MTLSPAFRRKWPSAYAAIEQGQQDQEWLEGFFAEQIPREGSQMFALDGTAWPHPQAGALADRQYVYSPTPAVDGGSIVVGHPYPTLAWVPECRRSWVLPISVWRITSQQMAVEVSVVQVKQLCHRRRGEMAQWLHLIVGDCKYGDHRFLGSLKLVPAFFTCPLWVFHPPFTLVLPFC